MQKTTTALTVTLDRITEGHRYAIVVTGATAAVALQFQQVAGGTWFAHPEFNATPSAGGVIMSEVTAIGNMRLTVGGGQVTPWTSTWVRRTMDTF